MPQIIALVFAILTLHGSAGTAIAGESPVYVVAPGGDDTGTGDASHPLGTIRRALELVAGQTDATIVLRPGVYDLVAPLRLTEANDGLTIRAETPGTATLRGGISIPADSFEPVTDEAVLARLIDPEARGRLVCVSLAGLGVGEIEAPTARGFPVAAHPGPIELFVNDEPMTVARWPNAGFAQTGAVTDGKTESPVVRVGPDAAARLEHWRSAEEPWAFGYWWWDWADQSLPVSAVNPESGTITLGEEHRYGVREGRPFWVENLLEEIDQPGEYFLDRATGLLYLDPPDNMASARIEISTVREPLVAIRGASGVSLEGLVIGPTRGVGVRIEGGKSVTVAGCTVRNVGQTGVVVVGGHGHRLRSCEIRNTGEGGAVVNAGDRPTLTRGDCVVDNCHFQNFSRRVMTYRPAVSLQGVGNTVRHCLIEDAPHSAIIFGGNDHTIELNEVRRVLTHTGDGGAFYTGRDWSTRGTVIRHNAFYDLVGERKWENAVYIDDMASGVTIEGNLFVDCHWATLLGGGRDLRFVNNIIVRNDQAVHLDARMLGWASGHLDLMTERLEAMPYRDEPWRSRYPELLTLLGDEPAVPKHNVIERNLLVNSGPIDSDIAPQARANGTIENNWATDTDPGFVDLAGGDFRLRDDAEAFRRIPGFEPIPVRDIGRYRDEWVRERP